MRLLILGIILVNSKIRNNESHRFARWQMRLLILGMNLVNSKIRNDESHRFVIKKQIFYTHHQVCPRFDSLEFWSPIYRFDRQVWVGGCGWVGVGGWVCVGISCKMGTSIWLHSRKSGTFCKPGTSPVWKSLKIVNSGTRKLRHIISGRISEMSPFALRSVYEVV
jgi:hypothetical protein